MQQANRTGPQKEQGRPQQAQWGGERRKDDGEDIDRFRSGTCLRCWIWLSLANEMKFHSQQKSQASLLVPFNGTGTFFIYIYIYYIYNRYIRGTGTPSSLVSTL